MGHPPRPSAAIGLLPGRGRRLAAGVILLPVVLVVAGEPSPGGRGPQDPERIGELRIKAAFVYKFPKFVTWPAAAFEGPSAPFVIGVLGEDPFGRILDETVQGKAIGARPVVVERYPDPERIKSCHLLFIGTSESRRLRGVLAALEAMPVLTVSEMPGFAARRGAVGLVLKDNKVRFEINPAAAERAGLRISSHLLRLATLVEERHDR